VEHFILECLNYKAQSKELRKRVGAWKMRIDKLLGDTILLKHTMEYVGATKRMDNWLNMGNDQTEQRAQKRKIEINKYRNMKQVDTRQRPCPGARIMNNNNNNPLLKGTCEDCRGKVINSLISARNWVKMDMGRRV
jgi:hypothetical protein